MLRILAVLLALCNAAHSEEGSPREPESKAETAKSDDQHSGEPQQITVPANRSSPTIINIYTGKHSGQESHCAKPKDWKEWPAFAWCKADAWIDAERVIALFTVILGVATWKLWRATDALVKGAEDTGKRQLRAYLVVEADVIMNFEADKITIGHFWIRNVGQTPPHDVIMATGVHIAPPRHTPVFDKPSSESLRAEANARRAYFAQQTEVHKNAARAFSQVEIDSVLAGESRLCVGGRVYYKDIFNNEWHTDFLYVYSGPETKTMIPAQYETGNDAT
jgi:hypothetical protein